MCKLDSVGERSTLIADLVFTGHSSERLCFIDTYVLG
jgi:hypothetical protein